MIACHMNVAVLRQLGSDRIWRLLRIGWAKNRLFRTIPSIALSQRKREQPQQKGGGSNGNSQCYSLHFASTSLSRFQCGVRIRRESPNRIRYDSPARTSPNGFIAKASPVWEEQSPQEMPVPAMPPEKNSLGIRLASFPSAPTIPMNLRPKIGSSVFAIRRPR